MIFKAYCGGDAPVAKVSVIKCAIPNAPRPNSFKRWKRDDDKGPVRRQGEEESGGFASNSLGVPVKPDKGIVVESEDIDNSYRWR